MKIAHIVYDLRIGGVTSVLKSILEESPKNNTIIILLCENEGLDDFFSGFKHYVLKHELYNNYRLLDFFKMLFFSKTYYRNIIHDLKKIFDSDKINVFHFHGLPKELPIGIHLQKQLPKTKLIYTDHLLRISDSDYENISYKILAWIYRCWYSKYQVVFVAQAAKNAAIKHKILSSKSNVFVVENSIKPNRYKLKTNYKNNDIFNIVYVSRISEVKRHDFLIELCVKLIEKDISNILFHIIGPDEMNGLIQQRVIDEKLNSFFKFHGAINNVPEVLFQYDIGIFPSEREGLPIALLEMMAAGLPILASNIDEIKLILKDEEEGVYFSLKDINGAVKTLVRLMTDLEIREKLGRNSTKAVNERFSQSLFQKYSVIYESK